MFSSTDSPLITLIAFSTPKEPIPAGCWATVAFIVPSWIALRPSSVASKPTTLTSSPALPPKACTAPRAISSFWAKIPAMSGLACRMFSATLSPSARSKLALWLATTSMALWASIASWKPCPLSRAGSAPGVPSSWATLPLPTSRINSSPARLPPCTLSEAMAVESSPPDAPRSRAMTGMLAWFAASIAGTTASESTGFTRITFTCWVTKFWMSSCCWAVSFCASETMSSAPASSAALWAPSRRVTKNGLFSVETESPILAPPPSPPPRWQPAASAGARTASKSTASSIVALVLIPLSLRRLSLYLSPQGVRHHRQGDHDAYDHLLPVGRDVQQVEPVSQDAQDERPDQGPRGGAHPAREAGAPDHDRRDGVEFEGEAGLGLGRGQPRREQDAGYTGEEPREGVDDELLAGDVYPGEPRCLLVAADGVHAPARVGAAEYDDRGGPHDEHQDNGQRHETQKGSAAQSPDRPRYRVQRGVARDHERQPPCRAEHR